jgi:hypothetical protein
MVWTAVLQRAALFLDLEIASVIACVPDGRRFPIYTQVSEPERLILTQNVRMKASQTRIGIPPVSSEDLDA